MYIPLKTMQYFLSEFEKRLQGYSVEKKSTPNGLINIYLLNDSLALLVEIPQQSFQFFQIKYGNHLLHLNNLHKLLLLYSITSANKFKVFETVFYISRQKNRLQ